VVSLDDLERLERLDAERAERFKVVDEFRAAFADVSPEEIEREAAKAVAEARKKLRAERVAQKSA
jgi:acetolactate synthase small subunit